MKFDNKQEQPKPLDESLFVLALAAMRDSGATGFVFFYRSEHGALVRSQGSGTFIPEDAWSRPGSPACISCPLQLHGAVDGILAFAFSAKEQCEVAQPRLVQWVATIERVWAVRSIPQVYRELLEQIIDLETELIDSKIVSRTRGVLEGGTEKETFDAITTHVESVLRPGATLRALGQILHELQEKIEERKWTAQAKAILEGAHGMSEEEAHSHLRKSSRQSRRRLIDVARVVVEREP